MELQKINILINLYQYKTYIFVNLQNYQKELIE